MFLFVILEDVLAYELVKIRFIKEKEVILNGNADDKSRGIQLIGPSCFRKYSRELTDCFLPLQPICSERIVPNNQFPNKFFQQID